MENHEEPNYNLYLPQEIMDDILLRLPAKSICRFKCVSNPWKTMLSDPDFVNKHINRAAENKDVVLQRRRVIFTDPADNRLYTINLDEFLKNHNHLLLKNDNLGSDNDDVDDEEQVVATELDYIYRFRVPFSHSEYIHPEQQPSVRIPFFHSCNGLILLELSDMELYLVNPATSEFKHLSKPPLDRDQFHTYDYHIYGFGFDADTGEYQLVQGDIFIDVDPEYAWEYNEMQGTMFSVYNFRTDSWKHRPSCQEPFFPVSPDLHRNENGVFLNGEFHWVMKSLRIRPADDNDDETAIFVIVALNAQVILTRTMSLPPELSDGHQLVKLGSLRDWLCVTLVTPEPHHAEIYSEFWVLKEYGNKESWTKMRVSIPYAELSHSGFCTESHDLMVFGERLVLYNFDEKGPQTCFRNLSLREIGKVGRVGVYIESLVSIRDLTNP